jgi:hypothetical protein
MDGTRSRSIDSLILFGIKGQQGGELCVKVWVARVEA